jgi:DNA (cytosine-5)-methyltransferase 1
MRRREDVGGARRLVIDPDDPCPTVMAGGVGSVNTGQYTLRERERETNMPKLIFADEPSRPAKPPYRVPSMDEVRALPWNGLTWVSTFSGCGGSSLGGRMAGFRTLWASEFIDAARDSYRANMCASTIVDGRDVRTVTGEEILAATGLEPGQLDVFEGSPPCSSFSTAGKRQAHWGSVKKYSDKAQRTDDLFFEFVRLLRVVKPRTFVAENVSGLVKGTAKGYFLEILAMLKESGYRVVCRVLDAQWLGVPQQRQRTIFIGVRNDLIDPSDGSLLQPCHPLPLPFRHSVREAIPWIGKAVEDTGSATPGFNAKKDEDFSRNVSPTVRAAGKGQLLVVEEDADMTGKATGAEWDNVPVGGQSERYFQLVKPALDGSCPTVTAAGGNAGLASVCHPIERRKFSIAELRRICAFPDDFVLTGSYAKQWERLGRAVPPVMMFWIARTIRDKILLRADGREPWPSDPPCLTGGTER